MESDAVVGLSMTKWKDIPGFPGYRVSDEGHVRSYWKHRGRKSRTLESSWHLLKPGKAANGYLIVCLARNRQYHTMSVHSLVLLAFIGIRPEGSEACHGDGNPLNNCLVNLRWGTPTDNHNDTIRHGTMPCGQRHWNAKLSDDQVAAIRTRVRGGEKQNAIARKLGVARNTISRIVNGLRRRGR